MDEPDNRNHPPYDNMKPIPCIDSDSVLFVSLDSCRYDAFMAADLPAMKAIGPVHKAQAPSHFTYGSHSAMFVGFTPGVPGAGQPFLDPKFGRLFRLGYAGHPGLAEPGFVVDGENIVDGFRRAGYLTAGTAAMGWFNPSTSVSRALHTGFETFEFVGRTGIEKQIPWMEAQVAAAGQRPIFAFMNIGETHVPYYFEGAPWSRDDNPCIPYQKIDRSVECRDRQIACIQHIDDAISDLLSAFHGATIIICADHGDCWGEDGLWEHGVSHPMTLTVPLIIRYRGQPVIQHP